ncbi:MULTISPECIES: DUF3545 family protein [Vibrio]|uniref:DUF3545 family protein n=2 Tax=Vibrio TaxID=662 RepID=A0A7X4LHI5_9VIBR|nr:MULTISPECIES: DUF3545 family protein [Vibrio]MBF9001570.1 DUF3545 family protein [Vibrio nitrifigilis]MZI91756.1 DUF3545 family protein [Vibrio eleionomae]
MDDMHLVELLENEINKIRAARAAKPGKRMWREIEALRDKRQLERELMEMDACLDISDIQQI